MRQPDLKRRREICYIRLPRIFGLENQNLPLLETVLQSAWYRQPKNVNYRRLSVT